MLNHLPKSRTLIYNSQTRCCTLTPEPWNPKSTQLAQKNDSTYRVQTPSIPLLPLDPSCRQAGIWKSWAIFRDHRQRHSSHCLTGPGSTRLEFWPAILITWSKGFVLISNDLCSGMSRFASCYTHSEPLSKPQIATDRSTTMSLRLVQEKGAPEKRSNGQIWRTSKAQNLRFSFSETSKWF